jgi:hypothetical protein
MSSVDRISVGPPPRQIERITDKRRQPEQQQRERREKRGSPEKSSDGRDHIIDELA